MQNEGNLDLGSTIGATGAEDSTDYVAAMDNPAAGRRTGAESSVAETVGTVRDMAGDVGHKAAERMKEGIADRKQRTTESLENVAQSLRTAGSQLSEQEGVGRYMAQAADQVDNLASFLRNHEVADLLDDVEGFARRQPTVFFGGAFALGVLGARFLKNSQRSFREDAGEEWDERGISDGAPGYSPEFERRPTSPGYDRPDRTAESGYTAPGNS
ncbi:MAG TPA: hypothetical protein VMN39_01740 [Longimicrobiaceae bacterium]|nr:hypothetical protein [Longimicrobiaceae bacterium]